MTFLERVLDVFSKRVHGSPAGKHNVPETTRNRVLLWCGDVFGNVRFNVGIGEDYQAVFWTEIHRYLKFRHGRFLLSPESRPRSDAEDAIRFLRSCDGDEFLDFLEYIFKVDCLSPLRTPVDEMLEDLNRLLREDNLPYSLTALVREQVREIATEYPFAGREVTRVNTVAYPKVIMRESEIIHAQAVAPALELLTRPHFKHANAEYLAAQEDYRRGDFRDCLTKAASAFESVLKVCFHRKRLRYNDKDTAQALITILMKNSSLEPYFETQLLIVATLRNRLSSSHGAGTVAKNVPRHLARYALNATAAAILLVTDEMGEN